MSISNDLSIVLYFPFNQYLTTDEPIIIFDISPSNKIPYNMYITITKYQYITKYQAQSLTFSKFCKYSLAIMDSQLLTN